jgi:glycine/D-amino acid oxidase-like deaminating enzyme
MLAPGQRADALRATLALQRNAGISAHEIAPDVAQQIHPLLDFGDHSIIGWEPAAGYADAYLTLSAYARAARRLGATLREGVAVTGLRRDGARVTGVETTRGPVSAGLVVSAQNMWSRELGLWTGIDVPLTLSRHKVMTLESATRYTNRLPVWSCARRHLLPDATAAGR